jgi:hypothetical protein
MKAANLLFWLIFGWFAPFFAIIALYLKLMSMLLVLLLQIFVLVCQGALRLAGKAIDKAREYKENRERIE